MLGCERRDHRATLDFRILGTLHVCDGGRELEIAAGKLRSLLAMLLVHANRGISKDALIEALWGDAATAKASDNLHTLVSRLRGIVGKDRVLRDGNGYLIRVDEGELDLDRFQELRSAGQSAQALELWRGPALVEFIYEPWAENEVRRLDELRLMAFEERIQSDLDAGRHAEVVPELQALVADQPLRETFRRHLIVALYQSERQAEALEAYRAARQMLDEELGLEPGPELRELERAVLCHDPALQAPAKAPFAAAAALRTRRHVAALMTIPFALFGGFVGALVVIQLLAQGGGAEAVAAPAPPPPSTVQISDLAPTTRRRRVVIVRSRLKNQEKVEGEQPRRRVSKRTPKTGTPTPRTSQPRREITSRRRHTKRRPPASVAVPSAYWLVDYFEEPAFDFGLWQLAGHGTGIEVDERHGRLEFSAAAEVETDGVYGVDQHYGTGCRLTGNFDARVEFELLEWRERNGMSVTFGAYFQAREEAFWSISRGPGGYSSSVASIAHTVSAADLRGTLRLHRANGVLTMHYRSQGHWIELAGGYATGPLNLILSFSTNDDQFGHQPTRAAFDNFEATATGVSCAGYSLPPYKPRR